jgi:hypothetical protein
MSDDKSAAALEREAEAVRSQMADTAETLREKMSPGQMIDEFRDYFRNSDGSVTLTNLKTQVRDNPLPLALIGAGLAWLLLGGGPSADRLSRSRSRSYDRFTGYDDDDIDDEYLESSYTDEDWDGSGMDALGGLSPSTGSYEGRSYESGSRSSSMGSKSGKLGSMASSASDKAGSITSSASHTAGSVVSGVKSAAGTVASAVSGAVGSASSAIGGAASTVSHAASTVSHAASSAGGAASSMRHRASRAGRMMSRGSSRMSHRVRTGYTEILAREPLVLGAIGLAVGSAIGAMLPSTRYENEKLGPYRDKLREEAERRVHEGIDEAKEVAESTYRAVKNEAEKQGLVPGGDASLTERVSKVASTAAATAENKVRGRAEDDASSSSSQSTGSSSGSTSSSSGSSSSPKSSASPSTTR